MKISHFVRKPVSLFHETPDEAGGGGGGAGAGNSLLDQVVKIVDGRNQSRAADLEGDAPEGDALEGDALEGDALEGDALEGDAPEGDAPDDWIANLPAEVQAEVRARIARLEGERDALGRVVKPAEEPKKPAAKAPEVNPLAEITDLAELETAEQRAEYWRDWAFENRDGGVVKGENGQDVEITAEQAIKMFQHNDRILRRHLPAQREALAGRERMKQAHAETAAEATKVYPWLADKKSPEFAVFAKLVRALPGVVNNFPDSPWLLADMVAGFMARTAKKSAAPAAPALPGVPVKLATGRPAVVPAGGNAGGGSRRTNGRAVTLEEVAAKGGSRDATVAFLEQFYGPTGE